MSISGSSFSRGLSGIYENETVWLQWETDEFTKRLEQEKWRLMILDDQIKQLKIEMMEKEDNIKGIKPSGLEESQISIKMKRINKTQINEELWINKMTSHNKTLKKEINTLRKEIMGAQLELDKHTTKIAKAKKTAKKLNSEYTAAKKNTEETNNQIISLKAKHESEKLWFEKEIENIQKKLKEKDETEMPGKKTAAEDLGIVGG